MAAKRKAAKDAATAEAGLDDESPAQLGPIAAANELRRVRDEIHQRALRSLEARDEAFEQLLSTAIAEVRAKFPTQADIICEGFERETAYWSKVTDYLADYAAFECELGELRLKENAALAGQRRREPDWHKDCAKHAKLLLATGTLKHELASKLAKRFPPHKPKAIREALKKKGVI